MFSSHLQGPGRSRFAPLNARCARHGPEDVPGSVPASTGPPKWAPGAPRGAQGLPKSTRKSSKIHGQSAPAPLGVPRVPRGWVPPPKSDPNGAEFDQKTPLGGKGPRTNIRKFAGIPSCFCTTAERVGDTPRTKIRKFAGIPSCFGTTAERVGDTPRTKIGKFAGILSCFCTTAERVSDTPRTKIRKFAGIPSGFCTTAERVRDTLDCSGDARRHHTNGTSEKNWPPMRDGPAAHLPVFARTSQLPVRFSMIA